MPSRVWKSSSCRSSKWSGPAWVDVNQGNSAPFIYHAHKKYYYAILSWQLQIIRYPRSTDCCVRLDETRIKPATSHKKGQMVRPLSYSRLCEFSESDVNLVDLYACVGAARHADRVCARLLRGSSCCREHEPQHREHLLKDRWRFSEKKKKGRWYISIVLKLHFRPM